LETGNGNNRTAKVIDFLEARRSVIEEHGTSSRGARSPLLEPLRKLLNAPDVKPLFDMFIQFPDAHHDLIRTLSDSHGIEAPAKEMIRALTHLGVERLRREALETYSPENWKDAVLQMREAARLSVFAGDWMTAEQLWLKLDERALESGVPNPEMQRLVMFELGNLLARRGDNEGAAEFFLLCEELAAADGRQDALASIRVMLGRALSAQGQHEEALHRFRQAADWAWETQSLSVLAYAESGAGAALAELGRDEEALSRLFLAADTAAAAGDSDAAAETAHTIARVLAKTGRPEQAVDHIVKSLRVAHDAGDMASQVSLIYPLFDACKAADRWGDFLLELNSAMDCVHETEQFQHLGLLLILSAEAHSERGLLFLALHDLEEAAYIFQALEERDRFRDLQKTIEQLRARIAELKNHAD